MNSKLSNCAHHLYILVLSICFLTITCQLQALGSNKLAGEVSKEQILETETSEDFEEPDEPLVYINMHGAIIGKNEKKVPSFITIEPGLKKIFFASIDNSDGDAVINSQIRLLNKRSLDHNSKLKDARLAYDHYRSAPVQAATKSKDALNILTAYRGFASSKEAGDVILDEKLALNGLPASELAIQKEVDMTDSAVVENLMQIATGLGLQDADQQTEVVCTGFSKLCDLVGNEHAQNSVDTLASWKKRLRISDKMYKKTPWSPAEQQEKLNLVLNSARERDPFLGKVTKKMHGYNKKSKVTMAASHVIEGSLGVACLVPSVVGPVAQIALTGFEMVTGGSEENKLLKQIYLSKRLESRNTLLKQKAILALQNYQLAQVTRNPSLLAFSESVIADMAGIDTVKKVFGLSVQELKN